MWSSWSANLKKESCSFYNPAGGTTTLDPVTYQPIYTPSTPIVLEGVKIDLSVSEIAARQQLQDESKQKIVLDDTADAKSLTNLYEVTVDSIVYSITGVKKPRLPNSLVTVYIKEK